MSTFGFNQEGVRRIAATVRQVEGQTRSTVGQRTPPRDGSGHVFHAVIVTAGPGEKTDRTDERYWVSRARPINTNAAGEAVDFEALASSHPLYTCVTATNLAELEAGTHTITEGTPVTVWWDYDHNDPAVPRYWFTSGGGGGAELPVGQYQGMVLQNITQNEIGFDFVMAHAIPE